MRWKYKRLYLIIIMSVYIIYDRGILERKQQQKDFLKTKKKRIKSDEVSWIFYVPYTK